MISESAKIFGGLNDNPRSTKYIGGGGSMISKPHQILGGSMTSEPHQNIGGGLNDI